MLYIHPIFTLLISISILGLIVANSLMSQKLEKVRLIFSIINIFVWLTLIFTYTYIIELGKVYEYCFFAISILVFLVFMLLTYVLFRNAIMKSSHYKLFTQSVKDTKFNVYYIVDNKDRVIDISQGFIDELGSYRDEIIGKKICDVFDKTIRIKKFNDTEINNKMFKEFYKEYAKTSKPNQRKKREIQIQNFNGELITLYLVEQPIFLFGKYKGRMAFGEKRLTSSLMDTERDLEEAKIELNSMRLKFVAMLEITEEGLFFFDLDEKYIWGTDTFCNITGLSANTINLDEYRSLIYSEDLSGYMNTLQSLTKNNPTYSITYRLQKKGNYTWVREQGKRIFEDETANITLGFVKSIEAGDYAKTNIKELDNIKGDAEMYNDIEALIAEKKYFQVMDLYLDNIPEINEEYGRSLGNMMMTEYIRRIKANFLSESSNIYRIGGLEFILTITDPRKIGFLRSNIEVDENSMNLKMEYGSIKDTVKVKMGIATANEDASNANDLVACAKYALSISKNPAYKRNVCYYKEIK